MTRRTLLQTPLAFYAPWAASPWLAETFRELHVDAHFANQPAPYENFDAGRAAELLHGAGFQMVSIFAVCNRGYSYYPTKVGVMHPGLKRDFTGEFTRALKERGIRVLAYVSVRECPVSPWLEQVHLPQLKEIVDLYGVDGFFFDAVLGKFVTGATCGGQEAAARYIDTVAGALPPGLAYAMNHVWVTANPVNPPASLKQLVWEPVPPYTGKIASDFSLQARYLSTIPGVDNWSCMTTRGNGWGDYSIREVRSYLQEAAIVLASGGRPYFGDVSYASGNPEPEVYKRWREVNARTAALEPYVRDVKPVKEIAVLLSAESMRSKPSLGVPGAHRALIEEHAQFSILNSQTLVETLSDYKVLILAEQAVLSAREVDAISRFVKAGGALIATGETDFAIAGVLGVKPLGPIGVRRAFLRREYDIQVNGPYQRIEVTTAKPLVELARAAGEAPDGPGITVNGRVIYCAAGVFGAYHQSGTAALRELVSWMLAAVFPPEERQVRIEDAPLCVEMTLNRRQDDRFLHLVQQSDDFRKVDGILIRLRSATRPKRVLLVPEKRPVPFEWQNGEVSFRALPLEIHSAYKIEG